MNREQEMKWVEQSNVTIPMEYFDNLKWLANEYLKLLEQIEDCFQYDGEDIRANVEKLLEVTFKETDKYSYDGYPPEHLIVELKEENGRTNLPTLRTFA